MSKFYVLITDGDTVDQIAEGEVNAKREKRDLEAMGCMVSMIGPVSAAKADELVDHFDCGSSLAQLRRMAKEEGQ